MKDMSRELESERKKAFLKLLRDHGITDEGEDVESILRDMESDMGYFSFSKFDSVFDVVDQWPDKYRNDFMDNYSTDVNKELSRYGLSLEDPVYVVNWGAEPLYILVSDINAVVLDTAYNEPEVYTLAKFLHQFSGAEGLSVSSDIDVALKHMGVEL